MYAACTSEQRKGQQAHPHLLQLAQCWPDALAPCIKHLQRLHLERLGTADANNLQDLRWEHKEAVLQGSTAEEPGLRSM
jgi:hypothetical protein